jgi:hypothetical protein
MQIHFALDYATDRERAGMWIESVPQIAPGDSVVGFGPTALSWNKQKTEVLAIG